MQRQHEIENKSVMYNRSFSQKVSQERLIINNPFLLVLTICNIDLRLIEFFKIWPIEQWIYSLLGLVAMYWIATGIYNKRLSRSDLEMSFQFRFWMIMSDLLVNLALGLYYLGYRETIMGQLMLKCPIAVSPVIFIVELLLVVLIKEYEIKVRRNRTNI